MSEPARKQEVPTGTVSVRVAGRDLRLRTDNGEALAREAADLLSTEIQRAKGSPAAPSTNDAVLLAALNLAGELISARNALAACEAESARQVTGILAKLDEHLGD